MRVEHITIQYVHSNAAGLGPASKLHCNIGSAEHQAFLAAFQFTVQVLLRNSAGILVAQQVRNGLAHQSRSNRDCRRLRTDIARRGKLDSIDDRSAAHCRANREYLKIFERRANIKKRLEPDDEPIRLGRLRLTRPRCGVAVYSEDPASEQHGGGGPPTQ